MTPREADHRSLRQRIPNLPSHLYRLFPERLSDKQTGRLIPFSSYHLRALDAIGGIAPGHALKDALMLIFPRGGAKSTLLEMLIVVLGGEEIIRYPLYLSRTLDPQTYEHVANIRSMLASPRVLDVYPGLRVAQASEAHGQQWNEQSLRCENGLVIRAASLKSGIRGTRADEQRPDFIALDDLDDVEDGPDMVGKLERVLTQSVLPSGTAGATTVVWAQNLVHEEGMLRRCLDGRADYLQDRTVLGPYPAVEGPEWGKYIDDDGSVKDYLVRGTPTWPEGQSLQVCNRDIAKFGRAAFEREKQQNVAGVVGSQYEDVTFVHCDLKEVPWGDIMDKALWCDPTTTATNRSDNCGIQGDVADSGGVIYRLFSWEGRALPSDVLMLALRVAHDLSFPYVGIEVNQGGEHLWQTEWQQVIVKSGLRPLPLRVRVVTQNDGSKVQRGSQMAGDYKLGARIVHVRGTHEVLERALGRFPVRKPFDLADAAWHSWAELRNIAPSVEAHMSVTIR